MNKCMYCDIHFHICHNGKSDVFLQSCQRQKKSCSLFVSRGSANKKQKKRIEELDWTDDKGIHFVFVFWKTSGCFANKHKRTDYIAKVYNHSDDDIVKLRIFYCHTCNRYYANGNLLPDEDVMHHLNVTYFVNMHPSYYAYNDMSPQSILRQNGYTVKEGSLSYQRHRILDQIIESGILTPYQIINHLGGLIDWHYWDSKWDNAVSKWQEDIHYVQNLDVEEHEGKFKIIHKPVGKK